MNAAEPGDDTERRWSPIWHGCRSHAAGISPSFVSRSDAPATRPNTHRIPSAHPFVLFVSFVAPPFLHGDRDATASTPPAITGSLCRFAASDEFIA